MGEGFYGHQGEHTAIACSLLAVPALASKKQISRAVPPSFNLAKILECRSCGTKEKERY
jgi:hypothetical protein